MVKLCKAVTAIGFPTDTKKRHLVEHHPRTIPNKSCSGGHLGFLIYLNKANKSCSGGHLGFLIYLKKENKSCSDGHFGFLIYLNKMQNL